MMKIKGSISLNKEENKYEHMNYFFEDYNDSYIESNSNSSILPFYNKDYYINITNSKSVK